MPRTKPITVGARVFAKQGDAILHYRQMLNRYDFGDYVAGGDAVELGDLLKLHSSYAEKSSGGIEGFQVDHDGYGWKCFWILRTDGGKEKFSYIHCITGR